MNVDKIVKYTARIFIFEFVSLLMTVQWMLAANVKSGGGLPLFDWTVFLFANLALICIAAISDGYRITRCTRLGGV